MASFHIVAWIAVPLSSTSSIVQTRPSPRALRNVRTAPWDASVGLIVQVPA